MLNRATYLIKNLTFLKSHLLLSILLIVLTSTITFAQNSTAGASPGALAPGAPAGSFALSDFDNVNPANGNLNYNMPLVKVAGRGSVGHTISLVIDNRKWKTVSVPSVYDPEIYDWLLSENLRYPAAPKYSPGYLYGYYTGYYPKTCAYHGPDQPTGPQETMTQLMFTAPDGTEYTLHSVNGNGGVGHANPCDRITPGFNRGKNFITTDGSAVTYVSDSDIYDNTAIYGEPGSVPNMYGYLKMSDGTQYRIEDGWVVWAQDRNGNRITFGYDSNHTKLSSVTDSIGRQVTVINSTDPSHSSCDEITYKGFGGVVDRKIYVCYAPLGSSLRMTRTGDPQSAGAWTYSQLFPSAGTTDLYNPSVVSYVELPDGRKYNYFYNLYGELARVEMPTGSAVEYDHGAGLQNAPAPSGYYTERPSLGQEHSHIYRRVIERRVYLNKTDSTPQSRMTYGSAEIYNSSTQVIDFSGYVEVKLFEGNSQTPVTYEKNYYAGPVTESIAPSPGYALPLSTGGSGVLKTESFDSNGTLLRRVTNDWQFGTVFGQGVYNASVTVTLADVSPSLTSKQTFAYDQYNNLTDTWEYGFSTDPNVAGQLIRHSHADYLTTNSINSINYTTTDVHIRRLPKSSWVKGYDSNGQEHSYYSSYSEMVYDESGYILNDYGTVTGWSAPSTSARGNPTTAKAWLNTDNSYIQTKIQFDQTGNPRKTWDAKGNTSEVAYWSYNNTYAFPITTTSAVPDQTGTNGSNAAFTSSTTYDFSTGLVTSTTDANNQQTTISYVNSQSVADLLDRPLKVSRPDGGWTAYEYGDTVGNLYVKTTASLDATNTLTNYGFFDGLGRSVRSFSQDSGGWVVGDTQYDELGRVRRVSNPYRTTSLTASVNPSDLWTTSTYDSLGRVVEVKTPDNAVVTTAYSGSTVTVTDQAGRKRRSVTDALGRLIRVDEPKKDTGELDISGSPYQSTNYTYDVLGNLLKVEQGVQTRTFVYDSLSRLTSATNPELGTATTYGTINYTYDANGNLSTKLDPRGIRTDYTYDALNRVISRAYKTCQGQTCTSEGTPDVSFYYDGKGLSSIPSNSKGALTKVYSSVSETRYTGFDVIGRVTSNEQVTNGTTYQMSYSYNLAGALTSQTYPSGRVVKNVYDSKGDLIQVFGKVTNKPLMTYANEFKYTASGAVEGLRLGNNRWESTVFNSRLQPTQIALGTTQNATDLLKLNYTYGVRDSQGNLDVTKNNGSVESQTITVPAVGSTQGFTAVQSYAYDYLNRLQSASETRIGQSQPDWKQTYSYDRYGNRNFDEANTTTLPKECGTAPNLIVCESAVPVVNPTIITGRNRLEGYTYDTAGNVTKSAQNKKFTYDGENKQTKVETVDANGNVIATNGEYVYDGDGQRVKKIVGSETTIFVYNVSGQMVAEYSATAPSTNGTISYLTSDKLGTPRINTDKSGQVTARHDYMPFGEEITLSQTYAGGRTNTLSYVADNVKQKFTQKERDGETELDYFINRYYSASLGRFTTVDPENIGASEDDPQSWNGYAYARSNPVLYTDPDGLAYIVCDQNGKNCSTITDQQFYDARRADTNAGLTYTGNRDFYETGQVKVDGQVQYTYQQISIDDRTREFIYQTRRQTAPIPKATLQFFALSAALGTGGGVAYYYLGAATLSSGANLTYRAYRTFKIIQKACFVAGTPILTENGLKPIEEIREGDKVLSYNEKTKQTEYKTVMQTFERFAEAGRILSVKVEGESETLGVSGEHPFYVRVHRARDNTSAEDNDGEWREAKDLQVADEIRKADGTWAKVQSVTQRSEGAKVYNFSVKDNYNYFVGQTSLLAHNNFDCIKWAKKYGLNVNSPTTKKILENLETPVEKFVAQNRKGSIWGELSSQWKGKTVRQAIEEGGSTVRKLLTDKRFER